MAINIPKNTANINSHLFIITILLLSTTLVSSDCKCEPDDEHDKDENSKTSLKLRIISIFVILIASSIGVTLPVFTKRIPLLSPDSNIFFMVKAFAAGVILATGFIHVLPDAFENLTSHCLSDHPWQDFSFAGFAAMVGAIGTLMIDATAAGYFKRMHSKKELGTGGGTGGDEEKKSGVHTHAGHGGVVESPAEHLSKVELIRHRVTSQVLELGIMVHSVIIGITIGTSQSIDNIRTLMAALSFHQFFEGMGLGGCIAQAKFGSKTTMLMGLFFSLTTPLGVAIGIVISSRYNKNSPTSLVVQGILDAAAAGILIYMALVDLLAADFMNPKVQTNMRLQLGANISLLLGAGLMSGLAKWA